MESALTLAVHSCRGAGSLGCRNVIHQSWRGLKRRLLGLPRSLDMQMLHGRKTVQLTIVLDDFLQTSCLTPHFSHFASIFFFRFGHLRFRCLAIPTSTSCKCQRCTQRYTSTLDGRPFHSAVLLYFLYILLHWGKVCYFVWRFFGTLKCEAERRPRSVGVVLEFRFCEARCTFYHLISRILVQWRMELLRSVHISDPVYRAYGGFSKIFRHFQGS